MQKVLQDVVRPSIKAHAGRVVRIKGDGILVEFASAVEAVASAVALQQAMAQRNANVLDTHRIELRIGINLGDIVTTVDDVHGDEVNVAARLEPLAEPGGICVSATVFEHVRAKLAYPFEERGISDQLEQWLVERACDGFVISATHVPGAYEDFVRFVVPELQHRGVFREGSIRGGLCATIYNCPFRRSAFGAVRRRGD